MNNEFEFRVFGLRRCGNHAVLAWIISSFAENEVYFYNDIKTSHCRKFLQESHRLIARTDPRVAQTEICQRLVATPEPSADKRCLIQSYEDRSLRVIRRINRQKIGVSRHRFNLLILRDPYNLIASRLTHGHKGTRMSRRVVRLWIQHAREFAGETHRLGEELVPVDYNRFWKEAEYRTALAQRLHLRTETLNHRVVLGFGKGSSFAKKSEAGSVDYNERWLALRDDPLFQRYTKSKELRRLAQIIFRLP